MSRHDVASVRERFDAKYVVDAETGCWVWSGYVDPATGYARMYAGPDAETERERQAPLLAHRASYELHVGAIPEGMTLDHTCHTADESCAGGTACQHRRCVNPEHLEPVTYRENILRGNGPTALNAAKTHCPQGHPYDEENTRRIPTGGRACRACSRDRNRRRKAAA